MIKGKSESEQPSHQLHPQNSSIFSVEDNEKRQCQKKSKVNSTREYSSVTQKAMCAKILMMMKPKPITPKYTTLFS